MKIILQSLHSTFFIGPSNGDEAPAVEANDLEQELQRMIQQSLGECSRQRLRALQMALRRQGNIESRISAKELHVVLQVRCSCDSSTPKYINLINSYSACHNN